MIPSAAFCHTHAEPFSQFIDKKLRKKLFARRGLVQPPFAVFQPPAFLEASDIGQLRCSGAMRSSRAVKAVIGSVQRQICKIVIVETNVAVA